MPLEASRLREGRRGRSASPDTGQQAGDGFGFAHFAAAAGKRHACSSSGSSSCLHFRIGLRAPKAALLPVPRSLCSRSARWRRASSIPSSSPARAKPQPLSRSTADIVVIDADTIRDTTRRFGRGPAAPRGRHAAHAQRRARARTRAIFIRGASTNGTVVLIDGVRVGSATLGQAEFESLSLAQIDHIEVLRGPASSLYGADARRRRDPDLHAPRRRRAALRRRRRRSAATRSQQGDLGVSGAQGAFDYAVSLGTRDEAAASRRFARTISSATSTPTTTATRATSGNLQLGYTPAPGHRDRRDLRRDPSRTRSTTAPSSIRRTSLPDPSPDFRNHLTTRVASIDYRGTSSRLWTTTLQLASSVDDLTSGGTTLSRFKTDRDQATWQNALHARRRTSRSCWPTSYLHEARRAATSSPSPPARNNNACVAGYSGKFGASNVECEPAPRRQLGLRQQHDRQPRLQLPADAAAEAPRPGRNDLPGADLQRPVLPGLRRLDDPAGARPQHRGRRGLASGRHAPRALTVYRNDVEGPDRLPAGSGRCARPTPPTTSAARATSAAPACKARR